MPPTGSPKGGRRKKTDTEEEEEQESEVEEEVDEIRSESTFGRQSPGKKRERAQPGPNNRRGKVDRHRFDLDADSRRCAKLLIKGHSKTDALKILAEKTSHTKPSWMNWWRIHEDAIQAAKEAIRKENRDKDRAAGKKMAREKAAAAESSDGRANAQPGPSRLREKVASDNENSSPPPPQRSKAKKATSPVRQQSSAAKVPKSSTAKSVAGPSKKPPRIEDSDDESSAPSSPPKKKATPRQEDSASDSDNLQAVMAKEKRKHEERMARLQASYKEKKLASSLKRRRKRTPKDKTPVSEIEDQEVDELEETPRPAKRPKPTVSTTQAFEDDSEVEGLQPALQIKSAPVNKQQAKSPEKAIPLADHMNAESLKNASKSKVSHHAPRQSLPVLPSARQETPSQPSPRVRRQTAVHFPNFEGQPERPSPTRKPLPAMLQKQAPEAFESSEDDSDDDEYETPGMIANLMPPALQRSREAEKARRKSGGKKTASSPVRQEVEAANSSDDFDAAGLVQEASQSPMPETQAPFGRLDLGEEEDEDGDLPMTQAPPKDIADSEDNQSEADNGAAETHEDEEIEEVHTQVAMAVDVEEVESSESEEAEVVPKPSTRSQRAKSDNLGIEQFRERTRAASPVINTAYPSRTRKQAATDTGPTLVLRPASAETNQLVVSEARKSIAKRGKALTAQQTKKMVSGGARGGKKLTMSDDTQETQETQSSAPKFLTVTPSGGKLYNVNNNAASEYVAGLLAIINKYKVSPDQATSLWLQSSGNLDVVDISQLVFSELSDEQHLIQSAQFWEPQDDKSLLKGRKKDVDALVAKRGQDVVDARLAFLKETEYLWKKKEV